jgi:hypothetical protein
MDLPHPEDSEIERISGALDAFAKSLELKSAAYRRVAAIGFAVSAFLATGIVQFGLLDAASGLFPFCIVIAFVAAIVSALTAGLIGMIVDEQAASIVESTTGIRLGFAGKIKNASDAVDQYNQDVTYFNLFGPISALSMFAYAVMAISTLIAISSFVWTNGYLRI